MELSDFIPKTGSFELAQTKKTYTLRKFNLADESWLKTRFGSDAEVSKIFESIDIFSIAEVAYHQIVEEDKEDFLEKTVTFIDDAGKKITQTLGGYKLLFAMVTGPKEKQDIISALLETIGISRPMVTKIEMEQAKAKEEHFKKKTNPSQNQNQSTGQESLTSSVASMVGA